MVIPTGPCENIAERIESFIPGRDFPQFAEPLHEFRRVEEVFRNLNQTSTSPPLEVVVELPARSKWQDVIVNSH